jgi:hypothetical protein
MIITSFNLVPIDLGKEPHKAEEVTGSFGRFGFAHGGSTQTAELRSQVVVQRWSEEPHAPNMEANRGVNSWVGCRKLGCKTAPTSGMVLPTSAHPTPRKHAN